MAYDATLRVGADTKDAERSLGRLQNSLVTLGKTIIFGALTREIVQFSDQLTGLQNRLALVAREGQTSSEMFRMINGAAISLGAPLKDVGDLYFRIASNTRDLGISQETTLRVTELMTKAFQTSGLSMTEASGAILQFGQALSVGVLRGEELNSILENAPPIADAIANHFGVARGALKALGEQGKISSNDIITAITAAGDSIDRDFAQKIPMISNSVSVLSNVLAGLGQKFQEQSGISQVVSYSLLIVADAIISVYEWFDKYKNIILGVIEALAMFLIPLKAARLAFKVLSGPLEFVVSLFRGGKGLLGAFGEGITGLIGKLIPATNAASTFGKVVGGVLSVLAAGATALGLGKLVQGIKDLFAEDKRTLADKYKQKLEEINKRLGNTVKASTEAGKATDKMGAALLKFNQDFEKAISVRETALGLDKQRISLGEREYEIRRLIAEWELKAKEAGVQMTAEQRRRLTVLAAQTVELRQQEKAYEDIKKAREEALGTVVETLRAADPRLKVEAEYQKKRQQIEDAYTIDSTISYETYTRALKSLDDQYLLEKYDAQKSATQRAIDLQNLEKQSIIDKYDAEKKQIDFLQRYREVALSKQLQQQGFTRDEAEKIAKDRLDFEKKTETQKAQWAIEQGANVFTELGKYNRQAFEASKALNIAQAVMNTYTGVTKALATYPPPFNFLAAGATLAFGLAQIATIRSQQYSGRAIGGSVIKDRSYIVGENGPEMFTPTSSGRITANNQLSAAPTNITFNIQAVDARGVDQLLAERKPQIISMVRSAMADRGVKPTV